MNDRDQDRQTPVMSAAEKGHPEVVKELLSRGAGFDKLMKVICSSPASFSSHLYVMVVRMERLFL